MIVRVPTIVVKIEGGVGRRTVPLLITEMSFEGEVRDWSGKVFIAGFVSFVDRCPGFEPHLRQGSFQL